VPFGFVGRTFIDDRLGKRKRAKAQAATFHDGTRRPDPRVVDPTPFGGTFPGDIKQRIETVKFGINYRFGVAPAPVTARY
jgi:hypothetical protein